MAIHISWKREQKALFGKNAIVVEFRRRRIAGVGRKACRNQLNITPHSLVITVGETEIAADAGTESLKMEFVEIDFHLKALFEFSRLCALLNLIWKIQMHDSVC